MGAITSTFGLTKIMSTTNDSKQRLDANRDEVRNALEALVRDAMNLRKQFSVNYNLDGLDKIEASLKKINYLRCDLSMNHKKLKTNIKKLAPAYRKRFGKLLANNTLG